MIYGPVKTISEGNYQMLSRPFSSNEVLITLKSMAKKKSPGLDGFPVEFYLKTWKIIGTHVTNAVMFFFSSLSMPRIINATAIAVIPKCNNPKTMHQFIPISCCNTIYKCI